MNFIKFGNSVIHYTKKGTGAPALFGHSYLWDSKMWDGVVDILSKSYCCICVDLPGHGKSEALESLSLQKLSDIHKAVMMHEGYEGYEVFSLAGLSVGGMWVALLINDPQVTVDNFIILNSSLSPEPEETKTKYLIMLSMIEQMNEIPELIIDQVGPGFFSELKVSKYLNDFKNSLKNTPAENVQAIVDIGRSFVNRANLLDHILCYKGRVLVVAGEFDKYRSLEESKLIASTATGSNFKTIPAGHISAVEEEGIVAELIQNFL